MQNDSFLIQRGTLTRYTGQDEEVVVPPEVKKIGKNAFRRKNSVKRVVLPEGLTEIRKDAFLLCTSLETIELPDSLETLAEGAFAVCPMLKSIRIPPLVTELPPNLLNSCEGLERVELPEGLKRICECAFDGCKSLREIELPSSLEYLADDAFLECGSLRRLAFPSGHAHPAPELLQQLLRSSYNMRMDVLELSNVSILSLPQLLRHAGLLGLAEWEERGNTLPPDLEADVRSYLATEFPSFLSEAAGNLSLLRFLSRRNLLTRENVQVLLDRTKDTGNPEVTALLLDALKHLPPSDPREQERNLQRELETGYLSEAAFDASWTARRLKSGGLTIVEYHGADRGGLIVVPAGRGEVPVVSLADFLFQFSGEVTSLVVQEGIRDIGADCLEQCGTLESVTLPSTLKEVARNAFRECKALVEVRMAPGITAIQDSAFFLCNRLREVEIPEGVKVIWNKAFMFCGKLTRVSFPSTLESIRKDAFRFCWGLETLTFLGIPKEIHEDAFPSDRTWTIRTPRQVPEGPFLDWLRKRQAEGCEIICD